VRAAAFLNRDAAGRGLPALPIWTGHSPVATGVLNATHVLSGEISRQASSTIFFEWVPSMSAAKSFHGDRMRYCAAPR